MRIIVDVMGGDNPPEELTHGAVMASRICGARIVLCGDERVIKKQLQRDLADRRSFEIINAESAVTMEDDPFDIIKKKKNSSMAASLKYLADGGADALVSTGNTGALFVGATTTVHTIKGVRRGAIGTVLPFERPLLLLDSGANVTVNSDYLLHFAFLGEAYYSGTFGVQRPVVGLLNNGAESHKGTPTLVETYAKLRASDLNFCGNVEGRDIPRGKCDVLVTDGFTGNIVIKYSEGLMSFVFGKLKDAYNTNAATKLSALPMQGPLKKLKNEFSSDEYGGAPILGIRKPIIKAHGNSDAQAIKSAVLQAYRYADSGVISKIEETLIRNGQV